jgi:iron(III) transport system ATP-binding protein
MRAMTETHDDMLSVRQVSKRYGAAIAVDDASLALGKRKLSCLLGASGCGKSTLLRMIAGLETPDTGEISAGGRLLSGRGVLVPPEQRRIGLVFQDFALFPHLTAAENVAFGLKGLAVQERRRRAVDLLDRFGLAQRADAWPHTLSGGEQQRVAIARALAPGPVALLLDEPFSGLDGELRAQVREAVVEGLRDSDAAILVVTHDPEEAMLLGDELALMAKGRIIQTGSPEECYSRPSSIASAELLGRVNQVPAKVEKGIARCALGEFETGLPDGPAIVLIRPENLQPGPAGAEGKVGQVRFGGAFYEVALEAGALKLSMRVRSSPPEPGESIRVTAEPGKVWVISARENSEL